MSNSNAKLVLSFRIRILALVVVAFSPLFLLNIFTFFQQRELLFLRAKTNTHSLLQVVRLNNEQIISNVHELLIALSEIPQIKNEDAQVCSELLQELLTRYPKYTNIGLVNADGNIYCSGLPINRPFDASYRNYYLEAKETQKFAVGEYQIGIITGLPGINFGYPVYDDEGNLHSVVFAALGLDWLNNISQAVEMPAGAEMVLVDRNGTVLAAYPAGSKEIGISITSDPVFETILKNKEGITEVSYPDKNTRMYAFNWLGKDISKPDAYIAIGIDKNTFYGPANMSILRSMILLTLLLSLSLVIAWILAGRIIKKEFTYTNQIKKSEEKIEALNEALRLLNKILRHDILNDLTVVKGNIELFKMYGEKKMKVEVILDEIYQSVSRGVDFISKMKDLESAVVLGKELSPTDLVEIISEVKKEYGDITFTIKGSALVLADQTLYSVFDNLFKNAQLHGLAKRISITIKNIGKQVQIAVADDGTGVPDEAKAQLFEEGFTFGATGNTGMGLFIIKKTVERYGGTIVLKNNMPHGAIFVITLPRLV